MGVNLYEVSAPEFYRGADGRIYRRPPSLQQRLQRLRRRAGNLHAQAVALVALPICLGLAPAAAYFLTAPLYSLGMYNTEAPPVWFGAFLILALLAYLGISSYAQHLFRRHHADCVQHLQHTQLGLMVADDQYWQQVFELERESPWLKWAVVAPPRSLERHLEFAAAYQLALEQVLSRQQTLDGSSIRRGNCLWHAGGPACIFGGLVSLISLAGTPFCACSLAVAPAYFWWGFNAVLAKAGRLAALCDFFLGELDYATDAQREAEVARIQAYRDRVARRRAPPEDAV